MEHFVTELNVLLKLLDHESVSSATAEKMTVVRNLLKQLQPPGQSHRQTDRQTDSWTFGSWDP